MMKWHLKRATAFLEIHHHYILSHLRNISYGSNLEVCNVHYI